MLNDLLLQIYFEFITRCFDASFPLLFSLLSVGSALYFCFFGFSFTHEKIFKIRILQSQIMNLL